MKNWQKETEQGEERTRGLIVSAISSAWSTALGCMIKSLEACTKTKKIKHSENRRITHLWFSVYPFQEGQRKKMDRVASHSELLTLRRFPRSTLLFFFFSFSFPPTSFVAVQVRLRLVPNRPKVSRRVFGELSSLLSAMAAKKKEKKSGGRKEKTEAPLL
jgi:hypothetical protein